jgi:hypothetical protein
MELSKKIKIALDETRILILGAQILLGVHRRMQGALLAEMQCRKSVAQFPERFLRKADTSG